MRVCQDASSRIRSRLKNMGLHESLPALRIRMADRTRPRSPARSALVDCEQEVDAAHMRAHQAAIVAGRAADPDPRADSAEPAEGISQLDRDLLETSKMMEERARKLREEEERESEGNAEASSATGRPVKDVDAAADGLQGEMAKLDLGPAEAHTPAEPPASGIGDFELSKAWDATEQAFLAPKSPDWSCVPGSPVPSAPLTAGAPAGEVKSEEPASGPMAVSEGSEGLAPPSTSEAEVRFGPDTLQYIGPHQDNQAIFAGDGLAADPKPVTQESGLVREVPMTQDPPAASGAGAGSAAPSAAGSEEVIVAQHQGSRPASESDVGSAGGVGRKRRKKEMLKRQERFASGAEPASGEVVAVLPRKRGQNLGMVLEDGDRFLLVKTVDETSDSIVGRYNSLSSTPIMPGDMITMVGCVRGHVDELRTILAGVGKDPLRVARIRGFEAEEGSSSDPEDDPEKGAEACEKAYESGMLKPPENEDSDSELPKLGSTATGAPGRASVAGSSYGGGSAASALDMSTGGSTMAGRYMSPTDNFESARAWAEVGGAWLNSNFAAARAAGITGTQAGLSQSTLLGLLRTCLAGLDTGGTEVAQKAVKARFRELMIQRSKDGELQASSSGGPPELDEMDRCLASGQARSPYDSDKGAWFCYWCRGIQWSSSQECVTEDSANRKCIGIKVLDAVFLDGTSQQSHRIKVMQSIVEADEEESARNEDQSDAGGGRRQKERERAAGMPESGEDKPRKIRGDRATLRANRKINLKDAKEAEAELFGWNCWRCAHDPRWNERYPDGFRNGGKGEREFTCLRCGSPREPDRETVATAMHSLHADWDKKERDQEVDRILNVVVPDNKAGGKNAGVDPAVDADAAYADLARRRGSGSSDPETKADGPPPHRIGGTIEAKTDQGRSGKPVRRYLLSKGKLTNGYRSGSDEDGPFDVSAQVPAGFEGGAPAWRKLSYEDKLNRLGMEEKGRLDRAPPSSEQVDGQLPVAQWEPGLWRCHCLAICVYEAAACSECPLETTPEDWITGRVSRVSLRTWEREQQTLWALQALGKYTDSSTANFRARALRVLRRNGPHAAGDSLRSRNFRTMDGHRLRFQLCTRPGGDGAIGCGRLVHYEEQPATGCFACSEPIRMEANRSQDLVQCRKNREIYRDSLFERGSTRKRTERTTGINDPHKPRGGAARQVCRVAGSGSRQEESRKAGSRRSNRTEVEGRAWTTIFRRRCL